MTALIRTLALVPEDVLVFADEMRLGLHGQVRRRWYPRGVELVQPLEISYVWRYLVLAVSPTGRLWWRWQTNSKKEGTAETLIGWREEGVGAVVWDNHPSHRARVVREVGVPLLRLPSYAPELNPAERVFEELRRAVEGWVYGTIERKVAAVDQLLQNLAADPARVRRLAGWEWIREAIAAAFV